MLAGRLELCLLFGGVVGVLRGGGLGLGLGRGRGGLGLFGGRIGGGFGVVWSSKVVGRFVVFLLLLWLLLLDFGGLPFQRWYFSSFFWEGKMR